MHAARWYGWQILMGDGVAVSLAALAGAVRNDAGASALGFASSLAYLGASPLIHSSHGPSWRVLGSLGLRLGLPTAGLFIGFVAARRCAFNSGGCDGALVGAGLGILSAMAIDAALLAHEDVRIGADGEAVAWMAPFVVPSVFMGGEQLVLGVRGAL